MNLEKLTAYIPFFQDENAKFYEWVPSKQTGENSWTLPYPKYHQELREFIKDVYDSGIMRKDYVAALENLRVVHPDLNENLLAVIENADLDTVSIILTKIVRVERFCDGAWARHCDDKTFLALLLRIEALNRSS